HSRPPTERAGLAALAPTEPCRTHSRPPTESSGPWGIVGLADGATRADSRPPTESSGPWGIVGLADGATRADSRPPTESTGPAEIGTVTLIGAPVRRVEDARLLQGQGRYVADLTLSRMLHVAFLRSPHAHARIVSVDTRPARALPGVAACVPGDEIATHARPIRAESKMAGYHTTE